MLINKPNLKKWNEMDAGVYKMDGIAMFHAQE
jgi:hypothetical protein